MATPDETNDQQVSSSDTGAPEAKGSKTRLCLLVGLLALALFALWYDYKVARPAVENAYAQIVSTNAEFNAAAQHKRMTSVEVQNTLGRAPSETFVSGRYTIEAYRWSAGMPIELRGLSGDESPGLGLKTHDYYAVYRKDGPDLAFVTHFKFDLDEEELADKKLVVSADGSADMEEGEAGMESFGGGPPGGGAPGMGGPGGGGPGGGGAPGGGRGFDPEAMFAERDADGDGKLSGDEMSERMLENLEAIDTDGDGAVSKEELLARMSQFGGRGGRGGPGAGAGGEGGRRQRPPLEGDDDAPAAEADSGAAPAAEESTEAPAEPTAEATPSEAEASTETNGDAPKEADSPAEKTADES